MGQPKKSGGKKKKIFAATTLTKRVGGGPKGGENGETEPDKRLRKMKTKKGASLERGRMAEETGPEKMTLCTEVPEVEKGGGKVPGPKKARKGGGGYTRRLVCSSG